uniref:Uncharacterized protein n=1 Tax=Arundo donax TaxID=35708 RepID=A0A0A9B6L0_ARUDO
MPCSSLTWIHGGNLDRAAPCLNRFFAARIELLVLRIG